MNLAEKYIDLCHDQEITDAQEIANALEAILNAYNQPGRYYHDISHIEDYLTLFYEVAPQAPPVFGFGIIYHDIIYMPSNKRNEIWSACAGVFDLLNLSKGDLVILPDRFVNQLGDMIEATSHHDMDLLDSGDIFTEEELKYLALFLDCDLAELASHPDQYNLNKESIRTEYGVFTDEQWKAGRLAFLKDMLDRETIFNSERFIESHEKLARDNMQAEVKELENG